jgi:hypothetical protein
MSWKSGRDEKRGTEVAEEKEGRRRKEWKGDTERAEKKRFVKPSKLIA